MIPAKVIAIFSLFFELFTWLLEKLPPRSKSGPPKK